MLNIFLGRKPIPNYRLVEPANGQLETVTVKEDVSATAVALIRQWRLMSWERP